MFQGEKQAYVQDAFKLCNIPEIITRVGQGATLCQLFHKLTGLFLPSGNLFFLKIKITFLGFGMKFCFKSLVLL